jgi:cardiolipin synthase
VRISNTLGAVFTSRRVLQPLEARLVILAAIVLLALATVFAIYPHVVAYPVAVLFAWIGLATLYRGLKLLWRKRRKPERSVDG